MHITIAKHAGYCFGVERAVNMTVQAASEPEHRVVTAGALINNPQTIAQLADRYNVRAVDDLDSVRDDQRVIIRSHGMAPQAIDGLKDRGVEVLDATCPLVISIHKFAARLVEDGYHVVVYGSPTHPEIRGIMGHVGEHGSVVQTAADMERIPRGRPLGVVIQSTAMIEKVGDMLTLLLTKHPEVTVYNTICYVTRDRQAETKEFARTCDHIIVVGGRTSSNTEKLRQTAERFGAKRVDKIETPEELDVVEVAKAEHVGILAGASTPYWLIEQVVKRIIASTDGPVEIENRKIDGEKEFEENLRLTDGS